MATPPATSYAKSGDVHIAYQVVGSGPIDIVFVPGFVSNLDAWWQEPLAARFFSRLASFARVVLFDKRGTGLSDPVPLQELPTLEQRMDDVRAVMDAAGVERAALLGMSEGGPMSLLFAATHPERTQALVLVGATARFARGPDVPWGWPPRYLDGAIGIVERAWGTGEMFSLLESRIGRRRADACVGGTLRAGVSQPGRGNGAPPHARRHRCPQRVAHDHRPHPRRAPGRGPGAEHRART